jgi:hypothetical protein
MGNGDQQSINLFDPDSSRGVSGYNQKLNNTTSGVFDLPYGRGRQYGGNLPLAADLVLGGWSLSGINTMTSGQPVNLTYDPSAAFIATDGSKNSAIYRPNVSGNVITPKAQRTIKQYFNPNTVSVPTDVTQPYGNAGRNIGVSNSYFDLDFGLRKEFPIVREDWHLQFKTEFFNAFNQTNFSAANGDRSSSSFGSITSTFPARQIQFALKFVF